MEPDVENVVTLSVDDVNLLQGLIIDLEGGEPIHLELMLLTSILKTYQFNQPHAPSQSQISWTRQINHQSNQPAQHQHGKDM